MTDQVMSEWILLFIAHWLGDFVVQTDYQAKNKWHRWDALTSHVATYTLVMAFWVFLVPESMDHPVYWLALNCVLHLATDAVTSQATHYYSRADRVPFDTDSPPDWHMFFVVVGADQAIHYSTMVATWFWLS